MSNSSNISLWKTSNSQSSPISPVVEFWTYLISDVLSLVCTLFGLFYLLFDRTLRNALNNHVIIVLLFMGLIYELTSIPWSLYRLRYGIPWIQNPTFYLFSFFFDYGSLTSQIILFSWATIERHILIFHDQWVSTKKKRLFVHYLPIVTILIYCLIYYSLITFGPFCKNSFEQFLATGIYFPCAFSIPILGTWELIGHDCVSTLIIVIFSIALIVRVIKQKRRMNLPIQWRKHRKMTIQMLSISSLYLILNVPGVIILVGHQYGLSNSVLAIPLTYVNFFRIYIVFLFPFVCCASLSELRKKFKGLLRWRQRNQVVAVVSLEMNRLRCKQIITTNTVIH